MRRRGDKSCRSLPSLPLAEFLAAAMAVLVSLMAIAASSPLVALLLRAAWVTLSCYWLTPMRIRRAMAAQGVRGPPPRPLVGNLREVSALVARATADDMPSLSHDIVGRLMPHYVLWSGTYGEHATRATRRRRRSFVRSLTLFGLQASCSCTCTGASRGCA